MADAPLDPLPADERTALEQAVDAQRAAIAGLLDDLDEDEARTRLVPSLTTPLALVLHATFVERVWFHHRLAGVPRAELGLPDDVADSFVPAPDDTIASTRSAYLDACERSRAIAAAHDLDEVVPWHAGSINLRRIHAHMIAELARHAGHGDILLEQLRARRTAS